jgi:hypothetical protein
MSAPLATVFGGDLTLEQGSDVSQFGYGDLNVNRYVTVYGTADSTGAISVGSFIVDGGARVGKSLHVMKDAYVLYGATRLTETHIDTTDGPTTVTGGNRVDISVGAASQFVTTGGNLSLMSLNNSLRLYGGLNAINAVDIQARDNAGGISLLSGSVGGISVVGGSGGISGFVSSGNMSLIANNGSGNFTINTISSNQNLDIVLAGESDSQLNIMSSGTNIVNTALVINTTNTAGSIIIANNSTGNGFGSMSQFVGSGGLYVTTNTGGTISYTSRGAGSQYNVDSSGQDQNLVLALNGDSDSSLVIRSSGTNVSNRAILIETTNQDGDIFVTQPDLSSGEIKFYTGTGGFRSTTQTGGSTVMTTYGATSTYTNATTADEQHLYVSVTGDTNSKVIISSTGKTGDAVRIETTNGTGGIFVNSVGCVQLESTDNNNGVKIATANSGIPVKIGTTNSTTTIMGNLDVKGVTSTIESTIVTIDDNIIVVNNAPAGTSDGGLAVKRYQLANDIGAGDVVLDTPEEAGTVQNGGNTALTVSLDVTASSVNDYYNGYWIKITSGTGMNQVRRIRSYDGSQKIATIYSTEDQMGLLGNPSPIEGLDFLTVPDTTSTYALYPCHYVMSIWDESRDEFAFVCSNRNPSDETTISHYSNLHVNDLQANAIYASTFNGSVADITTTVNLNDSNTVPAVITAFPNNYGVYLVFVRPVTATTRAYAIFVIGRVNVSSTPGTVNRILGVQGAQYDKIDIQWRANEYPELYYRPRPIGGSGTTMYKIKIVSL